MATTMFFEETLKDQGGKESIEIEFGRSSFYRNDSIYIAAGGKMVIVDREQAKRIVDAMRDLAVYLNLD